MTTTPYHPDPPSRTDKADVCGAARSGDYYEGVFCERPLGHDGNHHAAFTWEQTPEDLCVGQGHLYGDWVEYVPAQPRSPESSLRDDLSDYLLGTLMPPGVTITQTKAPTQMRTCSRCGDVETDAEYEGSSVPVGPFVYGSKPP